MNRFVLPISSAALAISMLPPALADVAGVEIARDYLMDRREEIALSRSAGPEIVSRDATILVLTASGDYETAVQGKNGWTCFTGRGWTGPAPIENGRRVWSQADHFDPGLRAPQCFNALASESILEMHKLTTRLLMRGASPHDAETATAIALQTGELTPPRAGAMSYMLSKDQLLSRAVGAFRPHLMLYTPFADSVSTYGGADARVPTPPVTDPGTAWAVTVILWPVWSDGTPAPAM
ncbi:MAG: hypothetical protein Tsb0010_04090 [Parvularculaceae bacterium]